MQGEGSLIAGRYRVTRRLGSGAMGVVWLAQDEQLRRDVALKQLVLQGFADADEAARRAVREGRIAARLHHPNAVTIHDVTSHDERPVLVMEHFPSRSLAAVLAADGPLPAEQVARIGAQCASALAAAHDAGIVHRDVKPANVLVGDDGTAKITDFGISRAEGDVVVTRTGMLAGTPAYLAPEVARGGPATARSDVFALGATLYAALEGTPPFGDGVNTIALLHRVAAGRFDPPTRSGPVAEVVMRMLAVDPAARPDMRSVHRALAAATAPAVPGTLIDTAPGHPPRSRRWPVAAAVAAGLVLVGATVLVLTANGPAGKPAARESTSPSDATATTTTPAVAASQLEARVVEYYRLLPDDADEAWSMLGPSMRAEGRSKYTRSWQEVESITLTSAPRVERDLVVVVELDRVGEDGRHRETHRLTFLRDGGTLLVDADEVVASRRVADKDEKKDDKDGKKGG